MIDIEDSVIINQPVEKVFAFATNLENNICWQSDVILSEQTSEGPFGRGATYRLVNRFMGQFFDSEGVIALLWLSLDFGGLPAIWYNEHVRTGANSYVPSLKGRWVNHVRLGLPQPQTR